MEAVGVVCMKSFYKSLVVVMLLAVMSAAYGKNIPRLWWSWTPGFWSASPEGADIIRRRSWEYENWYKFGQICRVLLQGLDIYEYQVEGSSVRGFPLTVYLFMQNGSSWEINPFGLLLGMSLQGIISLRYQTYLEEHGQDIASVCDVKDAYLEMAFINGYKYGNPSQEWLDTEVVRLGYWYEEE